MKDNELEKTGQEPMDEAARQKQRQQTERRRLFQMLAGGYLVYLAYQLIKDVLAENTWGAGQIACLVCGVLFAAFGIFVLVRNLKAEAKEAKNAKSDNEEGEKKQ